MGDEKKKGLRSRVVTITFVMAFLSTSLAVFSAYGTKSGWLNYRIGLLLLQVGGYSALLSTVLGLVSFIWTRLAKTTFGVIVSVIALISSLSVSIYLAYWMNRFQKAPIIHDITTDLETPPDFKALLAVRTGAINPAVYGGKEVADQQKLAYPEIAPVFLQTLPGKTFQAALTAGIRMGWEIIEANEAEGRIEAVDTTYWFGFKDDIVIRVRPNQAGSRVDVRSLSRVGKNDAGTNARRIERFLKIVKGLT